MRCTTRFVKFFLLIIANVSFSMDLPLDVFPQTQFKLYCMYTPEFHSLYEDFFLPSIKDNFEIVAREYPQECPSGKFRSAGWDKTMLRKLEMLRDAIEEHRDNRIFFYSDIDIIFLKPILETVLNYLGENDFVAQHSWPRNALCAGFFAIRGNEKTLKLITIALNLLEKKICPDDQVALNTALSSFKKGEITWKLLPSEQFATGRRVLKNDSKESEGLYSVDSEIILNDSLLLFHASCCIGLANKMHFLTRVREEFLKNQNLNFKQK